MWSSTIEVVTHEREEILLITPQVERILASHEPCTGLLNLFTPHTTCALAINENADPSVLSDLVAAYRALVPPVKFRHGEGNSDAHFLSTLIGVSLVIPLIDGSMQLGTWQGIYFLELDGPRRRKLQLHVMSG